MSRTHRVKNKKFPQRYFYTREDFEEARKEDSYLVYHRWVNRLQMWSTYEEYIRFEKAYSHSDSGRKCYYEGVPKCARKPRVQAFRKNFNHQLQRAVRRAEEESFVAPVDVRDAGWYYW